MGLPDFTGEMGGLLAATWITAWSLGWLACVRIRVNPLKEHATKLENRLDDLWSKIESHFWEKR